jgi:hypothetical protein
VNFSFASNATGSGVALDPITDGGVTYESKTNGAVRLAVETRMINMATYIGIRY